MNLGDLTDIATEVSSLTGLGNKLLGRLPIFIQKESGVLFHITTLVRIASVEFNLPCLLTTRSTRKWIVSEVSGLQETVKEDMSYVGAAITLSGEVGDFDVALMEKLKGKTGVDAIPFIKKLHGLVTGSQTPYPITDKDGFLNAHNINYVIVRDLTLQPSGPKRWAFTLEMLSDVEPQTVDLFPEG